ncbi:MAG TPA: prolipoprotein diacylglyceryl transferase [Oligoflexia bacterium]|nr:prolipoprotein diacylglyceryl transferase [Oligoflexia bacterium]HMR25726.1 prolipoprotein diacylglyceryl transferase [Oligoflexia bacterium]
MIPFFTIPPLKILGLEFHAFGLLVAIGFFAATQLAMLRAKNLKLSQEIVSDASLIAIIFGIFGAHLFHVFFYEPELLKNPINLLKFWSGLSSYGGIITVTIALVVFLKRKNKPVLPYVDMLFFGGCLGFFFGRMGCFIAHDHPGNLSDFFLAVQFPGGARHDLGFYEMLLWLFIFIVMLIKTNKTKKKPAFWGQDSLIVLSLYAPGRFFLEFLRAQDTGLSFMPDARYFGLTPAHYVSLTACVFCLLAWGYVFFKKPYSHQLKS